MYQRVGAAAYKKDLSNTLALLHFLGNPHTAIPCVHIAGTNGKGSVSHMTASLFQEAGFRCGLYTSPHYKDFRERIKINGNYISEEAVIAFTKKCKPIIEQIQPSFFEMTVAMAFDYFAEQKCDYIVLETGLGGRLDSTNVVDPLLSVITNISYDHMNMLGNTLPEIATEKAGIIKFKRPVIIGETQNEVRSVFINTAYEKQSTIYFADKEVALLHYVNTDICTAVFDAQYKNGKRIDDIHIDIASSFQKKNCITFLCIASILQKLGLPFDDAHIKNALVNIRSNTRFIGRLSILSTKPFTLIDSAHNEAGIQLLLEEIQKREWAKIHWVYGTVNDKDIKKVTDILPKKHIRYYLCKPKIPRGMPVDILLKHFTDEGFECTAFDSVADAYLAAKQFYKENDLILISGSIFVVAEVL